jgi:putative membrane protein
VLSSLALAHFGPGFGFGGGFLFFLIPLFWIVVLFLIFGVFGRRWRRRAFESGHFGPGAWGAGFGASRAAEVTLAERFAQGDIDEVEYRARLEVLRANNVPPAR